MVNNQADPGGPRKIQEQVYDMATEKSRRHGLGLCSGTGLLCSLGSLTPPVWASVSSDKTWELNCLLYQDPSCTHPPHLHSICSADKVYNQRTALSQLRWRVNPSSISWAISSTPKTLIKTSAFILLQHTSLHCLLMFRELRTQCLSLFFFVMTITCLQIQMILFWDPAFWL